MKLIFKKTAILLFFAATSTVAVYGQEEKKSRFSIDVGADLVSSYVWRGMYTSGASFQPELSLSAYGLRLGAWGSSDFTALAKEVDFFLSYETGGFSIGITDYWWMGEGHPYFKKGSSHILEASLGYTISENVPLSLGVNTLFYGDEDKQDNKQQFSSYFTAGYSFSVKSVDCEVGVGLGISPLKNGMFTNEGKVFDVASISARASKNLQFTEKFAMSVFVELILSPARDNAYLVFGIGF